MAKKIQKSQALKNIRAHRGGLNQTEFWKQFGVTQSGGSRYEGERKVPTPVATLIVLREQGVVSEEQLAEALAVAKASA